MINTDKLPYVKKAVDALFTDQGLPPPVKFWLPQEERIDWKLVDKLLEKLLVPDPKNPGYTKLEMFCVGDQDEDMRRLMAEMDKEEGEYLHRAVDWLFLEIVS